MLTDFITCVLSVAHTISVTTATLAMPVPNAEAEPRAELVGVSTYSVPNGPETLDKYELFDRELTALAMALARFQPMNTK